MTDCLAGYLSSMPGDPPPCPLERMDLSQGRNLAQRWSISTLILHGDFMNLSVAYLTLSAAAHDHSSRWPPHVCTTASSILQGRVCLYGSYSTNKIQSTVSGQ